VQALHELTVCVRQDKRHYHNRSHSEEFRCPICGRIGRQNLNWLGNRRGVYCDGVKFTKRDRRPGDYEKEQRVTT